MRARLVDSQVISSSVNSSSLLVKHLFLAAIQLVVTGSSSPVASMKIQVSEDNENWEDLSGSETNISGDGNEIISVSDFSYHWLRLSFSVTSGSFTASVIVGGKEIRV